jgi:hypothetical protein
MREILDRLGIKVGPPLSRRELKWLDQQEREWHREIGAYMEAHGVGYDEAFVACGGTIRDDATGEITRPPAKTEP